MKKTITRRLAAAVLGAALLLSPVGVFAEAEPVLPLAQVVITMEDGSQQMIPVQTVQLSTGEMVYWLDISLLTPEQVGRFSVGQLTVTDPSGTMLGAYSLSGTETMLDGEGIAQVFDAADPTLNAQIVIAPMPVPEQPQDAEGLIISYALDAQVDMIAAQAAQAELDRLAAEQAELDRLAAEQAELDRLAAEQAELDRLAAEQAELDRLAAEQAELDRLAAEQAELDRLAAEQAELDRLAAEQAELDRLAAEQAELDRLAAEQAELDRLAAEQAELDRLAAEQAELDRLAAEQAELDRLAAEQAAANPPMADMDLDNEDGQQENEFSVPGYVMPMQDATNLRTETSTANDNVIVQVGMGDLLAVYGYSQDMEGNLWWQVQDYRTGYTGYMLASVVSEISVDDVMAVIARIDEEKAYAEQLAQQGQQPIVEETVTPEQGETGDAFDDAGYEAEEDANDETVDDAGYEEGYDAEDETEEETEDETGDVTGGEDAAGDEDADASGEDDGQDETVAAPAVNYAVTNNRNSDVNTLRNAPDGDKLGEYPNDVLVIFGEPEQDGKWYPVTIVEDGAQGYMRDYLLTQIAQSDAEGRMAAILAEKNAAQSGMQNDTYNDVYNDTYPEAITPDNGEDDEDQSEDAAQSDVQDGADETGDETEEETGNDAGYDVEDGTDDETGDVTGGVQLPEGMISSFPAYGMTLEQANGAMIVLRKSAGGDLPQDGAIPVIREPSPLEISAAELDANGSGWYLVRNMNNNESGYIEAFKVEEVTKETAEGAIKEIVSVIPPVPSQNENPGEGSNAGEGDEQDEEPTEEKEPEATPEPVEPDVPQALEEGSVYHYGRNTGKQVALREKPNTNGKLVYRMESGTVVWVMEMDGEWCSVRTDKGEGYMMAKFVELMDVREEQEYRDSLDDPEIAPESGQPEEPGADEPELIEPEETETPEPELIDPVDTTPVEIGGYAYLTSGNVALRSNADDNAHMQAMLDEQTVVYVVHSQATEYGEIWMLVQVNEMWGYVKESQIQLMTQEQTDAYLAALEAAMATPTPTLEPTATPEATATPQPQRLELYARVINDGTPLRGNPDPNAYLQNILDKETVVYLFQSQIAADGMTWYLVQYSGQWGFVRADLVRVMGEQETADYLAQLEAQLATPTPMPQVTPEPVGPESTSAYAKLIKDAVNLRRTPSQSGTSLGRIPMNTLLLVTGSEYDGTNTWYQVNYNGKDGYVRSDMAQMLTISELQDHLANQLEQSQNVSQPGVSVTPNSGNNTDIVINGSPLQDLIPVPDSWTNNVIAGMPGYATATPDPNATPTPVPVANPAALIRSSGELTVNNIPSLTKDATFSVYGKTKAYSTVTATVEVEVEAAQQLPATYGLNFISTAIAENVQRVKKTVGQTVADANGFFEMDVTLPEPGEYIVEFASADGAFAQYGVTYDTGATPLPTPMPLPTATPVEENSGMGVWPFIIGGVLILVAAGVYGVYVYRRRTEEEDEDEEDEDEEYEMRQEQLERQRQRSAQSARNVQQASERTARTAQVPSYMRQSDEEDASRVSPYARPQTQRAPQTTQVPVRPAAPVAPQAPVRPTAPVAPQAPVRPQAPARPIAPSAPQAPIAPQAPETPVQTPAEGAPRRRRRQQVDQD